MKLIANVFIDAALRTCIRSTLPHDHVAFKMPRTPPHIADEFQISLLLKKHGWSYLTFSHAFDTHRFLVTGIFSYICDDIMTLCEFILENSEATVPFHDEPGGCVWKITPDKKQPHTMLLEIFELHRFPMEYREPAIVSIIVKRNQLVTTLIMELWKNALLFREPSFQKGRERFPEEKLRRLTGTWLKSGLGPQGVAPIWS